MPKKGKSPVPGPPIGLTGHKNQPSTYLQTDDFNSTLKMAALGRSPHIASKKMKVCQTIHFDTPPIDYKHLQCDYYGFKILIIKAVGLQIRPNGGLNPPERSGPS